MRTIHEAVDNFTVPLDRFKTQLLVVALRANGASSYRDAAALSRLFGSQYGMKTTIFTDDARKVIAIDKTLTTVVHVRRKRELIQQIQKFTQDVPAQSNVIFVLSAHGYSRPCHPNRRHLELNGRTEYIRLGPDTICDHELYLALFGQMRKSIRVMCLVDTCHSGTMLDLEYLIRDGTHVQRSRVPLAVVPECVTISACSDQELAGEDISSFGGWGGCAFLDYLVDRSHLRIIDFFRHVHGRRANGAIPS